jgi:hypothetical protein
MADLPNVRLQLGGTPGVPMTRPRVSRRPHQTPFGVSGTQIQRGLIISEEFNPDLQWKEAIRTYDVMRRTDPQVFSTLLIMELPIRSAEWKIAPATYSPRDLEIASFVESNLFHLMERQWDDLLRHVLLMLPYGFSLFEQTFRVDGGRVLLRDIAPRHPRTIMRWWTDSDNNLIGVQQWAFRDGRLEYIDIPVDVLVHFAFRQEGQNYEGVSVLRSAYKPWWYKQNFERIIAVGYEREHVGIPVVRLPEGFTREDLENAQKIGKHLRAHEMAYVTLPPGWDLEWLKARTTERKGSTMLEMMYYLDRQIQQNVLAQFLSLGTTDVGSYALSNDQSRVFLMSLQATAKYIASVFNQRTIVPLVRYNYGDVGIYPQLICQKIHAYNFMDLTASIANLAGIGVIPVTPELEDYVHDLLGIPAPPRSVVESTNPAATRDSRQDQINQRLPGNLAPPGIDRDESAGGIGFNEIYDTPSYRLMDPVQRRIYARMAREAGRPRGVVRLSATPAIDHEEHRRRLERRLRASEEVKRALLAKVHALRQELAGALEDADAESEPAAE